MGIAGIHTEDAEGKMHQYVVLTLNFPFTKREEQVIREEENSRKV